MYCKNCNSTKLRKELVSPFDQAGWYICESCMQAGPLWRIAQHEDGMDKKESKDDKP